MKTLLTIKQQNEFIQNNPTTLVINYGKTGRCTIKVNNETISTTSGGGYDKTGVLLAGYITYYFEPLFSKFKKDIKHFYGMNTFKNDYYLSGACGDDCMLKILNRIGFELKRVHQTDNQEILLLMPISRDNYYLKYGFK